MLQHLELELGTVVLVQSFLAGLTMLPIKGNPLLNTLVIDFVESRNGP